MKQAAALVLSFGSVGMGSAQPPAGSPWPMAGRDALHTGKTTYTPPTGVTQPFTLKWSFSTGDNNEYVQGTTSIGPEGRLYFGTQRPNEKGRVFCLSSTGSLIWKYEADSDGTSVAQVCGCPALGLINGYSYGIFFGDHDGRVRCLSPDGALIWRSQALNGHIDAGPVIASNGRVFVGTYNDLHTQDGKLYAFDPNGSGTNQSPLASPQVTITGGMWGGAPALVEAGSGANAVRHLFCLGSTGVVYHVSDGTGTPSVEALDITPGSQTPYLNGTPSIVVDDPQNIANGAYHVVFGTFGLVGERGYVYALNPVPTLSFRWTALTHNRIEVAQANTSQHPTGKFGVIESFPCIGSGAEFYIGTQLAPNDGDTFDTQGLLLKVTENSGGLSATATAIFTANPATRVDSVSIFAINSTCTSGRVIVAPENSIASSVSPDGNSLRNFVHNRAIDHTTLAMTQDGTVYFGTSDGMFFALHCPELPCGSE